MRRFRVALSFPGEHRDRVKSVAEALATGVGRERVLYDKWHAAEFNRANLDVYLPKLYHEQSDLIAVFLCSEYDAKEWCGLEWRACRDLLKHKEDDRLMFFRLDHADVPGLYSIDGYQDMSKMADAEVAADILKRIKMFQPAVAPAAAAVRTFTRKLPTVDPQVFGREAELNLLERAWANPDTNLVQIIAPGGTGKTALMNKWFRDHVEDTTVFGWSFYSQGTNEKSQTSADAFFNHVLPWFGLTVQPTAPLYEKSDALVEHLRRERVLLILDGVEPLQDPSGDLRDLALKALLQDLALRNAGAVLVTTRVKLTDVPDDEPRALSKDLNDMDPADAERYLAHLGVVGPEDELRAAAEEYGNNALALTLLGTYLATFCDGDVRRRGDIRQLQVEDTRSGRHARKVMASYARMYEGRPELDILKALGHFDRSAEPEALKLVLPEMVGRNYRAALKGLCGARLVLTKDPKEPLDCHPLVREHFGSEATREGHVRLCEHYQKQAPDHPKTVEEMTPLFNAVYHGCQAGRHKVALDEVLHRRINRGNEAYLTKKLGAHGISLSLLGNFFETPWTLPIASLSPARQSGLISNAGFELRALGRLADAVGPMRAAAEAFVNSQDLKFAVSAHVNLSELHTCLGNVAEGVAAARVAVEVSDRLGDRFTKMGARAILASALHQFGQVDGAQRLFSEAEWLQAKRDPSNPTLYSLPGYLYGDFLLSQGQNSEVIRRTLQTLPEVEKYGWLLDIGHDHLLLGRAHRSVSAEATQNLDRSVDFLRRAGQLTYLPSALLARGAQRDLDEAFRIATRSGMRLHLTDYHLISARNSLWDGDSAKAREHFERAEALIRETGYHRRDGELSDLREKLGLRLYPGTGI